MHRPQLGCSPPHFTFLLRQGSQEKALFLIAFTGELRELDIGTYHDGFGMGQSLSLSFVDVGFSGRKAGRQLLAANSRLERGPRE
jgi:hypothetical protein